MSVQHILQSAPLLSESIKQENPQGHIITKPNSGPLVMSFSLLIVGILVFAFFTYQHKKNPPRKPKKEKVKRIIIRRHR